ncbi:helix-turn-helix domain-containing protein [Kordiimonas lacus]|uniref:AraC-type DNA-binding protein n=1 Tax=Kordiimonas lacus TaxID=637679 RepID=A0A1G6SVP2_9PROT|nr:helix-turn-helix domain-containing protein [Kordiimonas lacus]SDD20853.1 AraC-type DNA-binding protein [Kordiimonas lacus]
MIPYLILAVIGAVMGGMLTAFAYRFEAQKSIQFMFAMMCAGNLLLLATYYVPGTFISALTFSSFFLFGPANWWLVRCQLSGSTAMFHWIHGVPFPVALALMLVLPGDARLFVIFAGSLSWLLYGLAAFVLLWRNRRVLGEQNRMVWLSGLSFGTCWLSLMNLIQVYSLWADTAVIPADLITLLKLGFGAFVILALTWWALVNPDIYLDKAVPQKNQEATTTDFDRETFERLEAAFTQDELFKQEALNLEEAAHGLAVTPRELSNAVNRCTGKSFRAYLRAARIGYAKQIMADPTQQDRAIFDIATEAGFATKSNFNDAFKTEVGMTPTEFRNRDLSLKSD